MFKENNNLIINYLYLISKITFHCANPLRIVCSIFVLLKTTKVLYIKQTGQL